MASSYSLLLVARLDEWGISVVVAGSCSQ